MSQSEIREAKRAWLKAKHQVDELREDLAYAEREVERAYTGDQQWDAQDELARTLHRLELAEDAEKDAKRAYVHLLDAAGYITLPGSRLAR